MTEFLPEVDDLLDHHAVDDPLVIETILRDFYPSIHRLASSILNDAAEAEDGVQETFIHVALNLDRYRPGTNFKAWLYTIAVNTCRGMVRKRGVRQRLQALMANMPFSAFHFLYPEQALVEMESHHELKTALNALDEKHRLPVILRFVHGLPIAEIAQILGVREGTVHSRLHYAIKKLKVQLEKANQQTTPQIGESVR